MRSAIRELSRTWSMAVPPVSNYMQLKNPHEVAGDKRNNSQHVINIIMPAWSPPAVRLLGH